MAETNLSQVSKKELAGAYAKLKAQKQKAQKAAKEQTEALVRDVVTIAGGAGVSYLMANRAATAEKEGQDDEGIKEAQQIVGVDMDVAVGGVAAIAGIMDLGGKMSDTIRALGVGALTSAAARVAGEKAREQVESGE